MADTVFNPSRKGDNGTTAMFGKRLKKSSNAIKFVGSIDYLQAKFGELYTECYNAPKSVINIFFADTSADSRLDLIATIIKDLYNINCILWSPKKAKFNANNIDDWLLRLPFQVPKGFQLPIYTCPLIAKMDVLRCEIRKAEITLIELLESPDVEECSTLQMDLLQHAVVYLNRLSSLLYAMVNYYNKDEPILASS